LRDLKGENPSFFIRILPFHNKNVDLSMSRMQREKTESKRAQGQAGAAKKCGRPATLCPQKFWDFPKIWKFGKKIMKKGNPNLGIITLFRSLKPEDVIILACEN
jgi:hypothetical protein